MHTEPHPLAGLTVSLNRSQDPRGMVVTGADFHIEDWWDKLTGSSWMTAKGNPAALQYAIRSAVNTPPLPLDDNVVYGKIGGLGHLVHVSELPTPNTPAPKPTSTDDDES